MTNTGKYCTRGLIPGQTGVSVSRHMCTKGAPDISIAAPLTNTGRKQFVFALTSHKPRNPTKQNKQTEKQNKRLPEARATRN